MRRTVNCFFSDEDFGLSICFVVALPQICIFAWEGVPCECGSDRWPAILGIVNADAQVFKVFKVLQLVFKEQGLTGSTF